MKEKYSDNPWIIKISRKIGLDHSEQQLTRIKLHEKMLAKEEEEKKRANVYLWQYYFICLGLDQVSFKRIYSTFIYIFHSSTAYKAQTQTDTIISPLLQVGCLCVVFTALCSLQLLCSVSATGHTSCQSQQVHLLLSWEEILQNYQMTW